jgi:hypothetical protein
MKIRMSLIAAAAAVALTGHAHAFGPGVVPDVTIFVAGGSAQGPTFIGGGSGLVPPTFATIAFRFLAPGFDVYTDQACGTQGANYRAVFGTGAATLPASLAGKKIFMEYTNNGGTFKNGIDGLVRAHAVDYQTFLNNSTACSVDSATNFTVANDRIKENHIPILGFSDEEIGLFVGVNLPAGSTAITPAELGNVTAAVGIYENVFGVAINAALAAQKTNFTKAELTAIFSGSYTDWSQLTDANGHPLPAGPITIIDQPGGSGTKAALNGYFLGNPNFAAVGGSLNPVDLTSGFGNCGSPAKLGSGSYSNTTYSACLQSSDGNVVNGLNISNSVGVRAIGILSMAFQPSAIDQYSFAALNGVAVSGVTTKTCGNAVANPFEPARVVSGAYDFFYAVSMQYRIKSINGAPFRGDGTAQSDAIVVLAAAAQDPATVVSGPGVLLDPAVVGGPSGAAYDPCITKGTRQGNSTQPLQLQF